MSGCFSTMCRGSESSAKFSNLEPAQNFRCSVGGFFQERAVIFVFSAVLFWTLFFFLQAIYIRLAYAILWGTVDFSRINTFKLTCSGCKIQIINDAAWAGLFYPSNIIMYFPVSNEVDPVAAYDHHSGWLLPDDQKDGFPSFCSIETKSCDLVIKNFEKLPAVNSATHHKRLFSDDTADVDFYNYPTIDLIIPKDWTGLLEIYSGPESSEVSHPTVIIPFAKSPFSFVPSLYPEVSRDIFVPSLYLHSLDHNYPIFFHGVRGGQYRDVTVRCVTGAFVARGAEFTAGSVVDVTLPMGDIIISANQEIQTTVSSIYSATPPFVEDVAFLASLPNARLSIIVIGTNFRNLVQDDVNLSVPNGTCHMETPSSLPGLGIRANISFECDFSLGIKNSGPVQGPILLSYFGGNIVTTGFDLFFLAAAGASASVDSPSVQRLGVKMRFPSGEGCDESQNTQTSPGNVCAVAALESQKVPPYSVTTANNSVTMLPSHKSAPGSSFKFISSAARSLTLGSFLYQTSTHNVENINMQAIAACPVSYEKENPATDGRIATTNSNYHIPYREQEKLTKAIRALQLNNVSFVIIKTLGGGTNLPGYFTLTKRKIYTVIDPTIIQTLTFGLLPIPTLAIDVRMFFLHKQYFTHSL
jgi:hypothetical protein